MAKAKIDTMEILDIVDFIWNNKPSKYYIVLYRDQKYRKYDGYWAKIYNDNTCGGYNSVDINFQQHLDRAWNFHFQDKKIKKVSKIIIS